MEIKIIGGKAKVIMENQMWIVDGEVYVHIVIEDTTQKIVSMKNERVHVSGFSITKIKEMIENRIKELENYYNRFVKEEIENMVEFEKWLFELGIEIEYSDNPYISLLRNYGFEIIEHQGA